MLRKFFLLSIVALIFTSCAKDDRGETNPNLMGVDGDIVSNESYDAIVENDFKDVSAEPLTTFSIDVDRAAYANVRRFVQNGQRPPADAVRIEELLNYFHYDYPKPTGEHPFAVTTELSVCPWNTEHRLLHIGLRGREVPKELAPASNLVFLIDVSGSMQAANKLPLVKQSLRLLVEELRPQDRVALCVYAGAAGLVLPSTTADQKERILNAVNALEAGGSTAGGEGLRLAYRTARESLISGGNNRVILATDGDFNVGASSDNEMVKLIEQEREAGVYLSVLGFGMGNYKDSKLEAISNHGNGNYAYIDSEAEAYKTLVREFGGTLFTIAKDVKVQVEFNPETVQQYRLIGYENRRLNNEDFNDDKKDAGDMGSGHTVTALYEIVPQAGAAIMKKASVQLRFRYKQPDANDSRLYESEATDAYTTLAEAGNDYRFAAAVAAYGLTLRNSKYKGDATLDMAMELAQAGRGADLDGYRLEFIELVRATQRLK